VDEFAFALRFAFGAKRNREWAVALLVVETKVVHRRLQASHFANDDKRAP